MGTTNVCQLCCPTLATKVTQLPSAERFALVRTSGDDTSSVDCPLPRSRTVKWEISAAFVRRSSRLPSGETPRGIPQCSHTEDDQNGHQLVDLINNERSWYVPLPL